MIFPLVALHDLLGNIGSYQAMINKRPLPGGCRIRPNDRLWVAARGEHQGVVESTKLRLGWPAI